jgi:translocation and assembly module TamB
MTTQTPAREQLDGRDLAVRRSRGRRGRRAPWGQRIAQVLCALLALVGLVPFAGVLVVRSAWAKHWAAEQAQRVVREQGINAEFQVALRIWPLAVELTRVRVDATDGGSPAVECERVRVRPRIFSLLAGKVAIDAVELDQPRVRAEMRDGKVINLAIPEAGGSKGPFHAPFTTFAVTDGAVDLTLDGVRLRARAVDVDVNVEDDARLGSSFEVSTRIGNAEVHRQRTAPRPGTDDDALCLVDGRVRIEPGRILIRHLDGVGSVDLDDAAGTTPACNLPADDKRRVELSLAHLQVRLPTPEDPRPAMDGHVRARGPVALAAREVSLPDLDGWIGVDVEVGLGEGSVLPAVEGSVEAHDIRLEQFSFAKELHSQVSLERDVIRSSKTTVRIAKGLVTLTDVELHPLAKGAPLTQARLDVANVDFTALMRDLGVHPSSWVGWDIHEIHVPSIGGTLDPLHLDGELSAQTSTFGIYDRPAEDRARERIFGVTEAQIASHVAIRPEALRFENLRVTLPRSRVEGALVSLGFHNDVVIDAPRISVDFQDVSPIGPVAMRGKGELKAHVGGTFQDPLPEGDIKSVAGFAVEDMAFGDLSAGHVHVQVRPPEVALTGVRAVRRESAYEVPTATLRFGGTRGFVADAVGTSAGFGLRDLLSMFALDDDPRFDELEAKIATRADVHVALGGAEDRCGNGFVTVGAKGHLTGVELYGEKFAQGDAEMSLRWEDRQQGIAGAEIEVPSFALDKVLPPSGTRAGASGSVIGSARVQRGGMVTANLVAQGIPLSRVDSLGSAGKDLEGSLSGMAFVTGTVDDFRPDAGLVTRANVDVSGTRWRDTSLPDSHLAVVFTQRLTQEKRSLGRTKCGAPIGAPFDRAAYAADTSSHGEWKLDGSLLGSTVQVHDVVMTRAKSPSLSGRLSLRGLELGPLWHMYSERKEGSEARVGTPSTLGGELWGELIVDDLPLGAPQKARARFLLGPTVLSRGGQTVAVKPPRDPISLADDTLTVPPLEVRLDTQEGIQGGFLVSGGVSRVSTDPTLDVEAKLEPMDLAVLQKSFPRLDRASGKIEGSLHVSGKAAAPVVAGSVRVAGDMLEVHGVPGAVTDFQLDVKASATEITASGGGKFAGGTFEARGAMPLRGFALGALDSRVVVRGVRLAPYEGIAATADADLEVAYDPAAQRSDTALPRVTGEVTVDSFGYTRPIALTSDLTALGARAKRTEVTVYDPSLDDVVFDVRVRSRAPFVIKNNLVEVQLGIDSSTLEVTGTNQRVGLRGALRTLAGGRFHFQSSDFEIRQGLIRFDDPTRIDPNVDITAVTEYRRYTDTSAASAAGASAGAGTGAASAGASRGSSLWRITLHAYGDADNLRVDMTSEPALSQEDIVLLLAVGMTRAELDQLQASSIGTSIALNYLGAASGADRAVKQALPIIDDFRFGSAYSTVTGKTEPQLTVGKRLTNDIRASVTAGLSEDRELRSDIEWRLNNRFSVQASYDNINDVSSSALGNVGFDFRWRIEFQ